MVLNGPIKTRLDSLQGYYLTLTATFCSADTFCTLI